MTPIYGLVAATLCVCVCVWCAPQGLAVVNQLREGERELEQESSANKEIN